MQQRRLLYRVRTAGRRLLQADLKGLFPSGGEECAVRGALWPDDLVINELTFPGTESVLVFSELFASRSLSWQSLSTRTPTEKAFLPPPPRILMLSHRVSLGS